jgi:hypothetical protein
MAYIFAGNLDSLAAQRNRYDDLNLRVAENAQSAYQRAQADQTEADRFGIRQNEEDRRQQQQQQYQFFQANQAAADRAQERAQQQYQFGATEADRAAARGDEAYRFNTNLQANKEQNALAVTQKKNAEDYAEAQNLVMSGAYDDNPEKIIKDYPGLQPHQLATLNTVWDTRNKGALAKFTNLQGEAASESAVAPTVQPKALPAYVAGLEKRGLRYQASPQGTNVVVGVPPPYQRPSASAVPLAPAGPAPSPYNFTGAGIPDKSRVVAPPAPSAQSGLVVGKTYKNAKGEIAQYLGGDISDPASWQAAQ